MPELTIFCIIFGGSSFETSEKTIEHFLTKKRQTPRNKKWTSNIFKATYFNVTLYFGSNKLTLSKYSAVWYSMKKCKFDVWNAILGPFLRGICETALFCPEFSPVQSYLYYSLLNI